MSDATQPTPLADSGKEEIKDKRIAEGLTGRKLINKVWTRLVAKGVTFCNVNFSYSTFDACYIRNCKFDRCNFTGCRFANSNFHGSTFSECTFDYATFEKTDVDPYILESEAPVRENLKMRFARSLRINYQQLGDAESINRAISIELNAKLAHLEKAAFSKESYYRKKYQGMSRLSHLGQLVSFRVMDFVWGNGESAAKLFRAAAIVMLAIGCNDAFSFNDDGRIHDYWDGISKAPQIFMGTLTPPTYPTWYISVIVLVRLVLFGLFMAVLIKRFNRR